MSIFTTLISSKIAAGALAVGTLAAGGTAAAAATNTLPEPAQEVAHQTFGAPAPTTAGTDTEVEAPDADGASDDAKSTPTSSESPESQSPTTTSAKGPDATGPAGKGLCTAWSHHGLRNPKSTAYRALLTASGSTEAAGSDAAGSAISKYCTVVLQPVAAGTSDATSIPSTAPSSSATKADDGDENESDAAKPAKVKTSHRHHGKSTADSTSEDSGSSNGADDQADHGGQGSDD
jgi:hypothetical protein